MLVVVVGVVSFALGFLAAKIPKLQDIQQSLKDSVATVTSLLNSTSIQLAPDLANCLPELQLRLLWWAKQHDSKTISHWSAKFESLLRKDSAKAKDKSLFDALVDVNASRALSLQLNF